MKKLYFLCGFQKFYYYYQLGFIRMGLIKDTDLIESEYTERQILDDKEKSYIDEKNTL